MKAALHEATYAETREHAREAVTLATVRLRQRVTKGAGSRTKGLLMAASKARARAA